MIVLTTACKKTDSNNTSKENTTTPQKQKESVSHDPEGTIESKPLAQSKALGKDSSKLFSRLDPETTGVKFINPILKDNPRAYLYASAMGCGGVSVGDINGDGRPDLFLTGGPVPNQLLVQTDTLKFTDFTEQAGLAGNKSWALDHPSLISIRTVILISMFATMIRLTSSSLIRVMESLLSLRKVLVWIS